MRGRELRWLVVFKRRFVGLEPDVVAEHLCCPVVSQDRYLAIYDEHGDVVRPKVGSRGRPTKLNTLEELDLVAAVLAAPCVKMHEHRARLLIDGGQSVSLSTLGRILHKHNITRQRVRAGRASEGDLCSLPVPCSCTQVQHMAYFADAQKAQYFWLEVMTFCSADEMLVEDETAKDRRSMQDNVGWGLRGETPVVRDKHLTRGGRVSSTCLLSSRQFEAWCHTDNTFKRDNWQLAMDDMLLTPQADGNTLASKFKCLLMDNASIHKDNLYLLKLSLHIRVIFIPPYCY